ncbi:MAG: penicillin acylase family protein, partial [Deltaproteobacteria bacterium]|nr:penicillin acylase family protein [Deltaproteobacteria bacterium]NIS77960.1 penicillin acylase family protein [Deltaproteobacteria bacterium]
MHIFRDPWGVPHIYADTIGDLLFAQGFVHAQERLFQMDAERRIASGRLSEVLGEKALPIDTLFRTVGLAKIAREIYGKMDEQAKKFVDRYTHGINRFIETAGTYPVEFRLLR